MAVQKRITIPGVTSPPVTGIRRPPVVISTDPEFEYEQTQLQLKKRRTLPVMGSTDPEFEYEQTQSQPQIRVSTLPQPPAGMLMTYPPSEKGPGWLRSDLLPGLELREDPGKVTYTFLPGGEVIAFTPEGTQVTFKSEEQARRYGEEWRKSRLTDEPFVKDVRRFLFGERGGIPSPLKIIQTPEIQLAALSLGAGAFGGGVGASLGRGSSLLGKTIGWTTPLQKVVTGTMGVGGATTAVSGIGVLGAGAGASKRPDTATYENINLDLVGTPEGFNAIPNKYIDVGQYEEKGVPYRSGVSIDVGGMVVDLGEEETARRLAQAGYKPTIDKSIYDTLSSDVKEAYTPTKRVSLAQETGIAGVYGRGVERTLEPAVQWMEKRGVAGQLGAGMFQYFFPHTLATRLYPEKGGAAFATLAPHFGPTAAYTGLTWKEQSWLGRGAGIGFAVLPWAAGPLGSLARGVLSPIGRAATSIPYFGALVRGGSRVIKEPFKWGEAISQEAGLGYWAPWRGAYAVSGAAGKLGLSKIKGLGTQGQKWGWWNRPPLAPPMWAEPTYLTEAGYQVPGGYGIKGAGSGFRVKTGYGLKGSLPEHVSKVYWGPRGEQISPIVKYSKLSKFKGLEFRYGGKGDPVLVDLSRTSPRQGLLEWKSVTDPTVSAIPGTTKGPFKYPTEIHRVVGEHSLTGRPVWETTRPVAARSLQQVKPGQAKSTYTFQETLQAEPPPTPDPAVFGPSGLPGVIRYPAHIGLAAATVLPMMAPTITVDVPALAGMDQDAVAIMVNQGIITPTTGQTVSEGIDKAQRGSTTTTEYKEEVKKVLETSLTQEQKVIEKSIVIRIGEETGITTKEPVTDETIIEQEDPTFKEDPFREDTPKIQEDILKEQEEQQRQEEQQQQQQKVIRGAKPGGLPFFPFFPPALKIGGLSGGGAGIGFGFPGQSRVGIWEVSGHPVFAPHPLTGEIVGGRVGRGTRRYGAVESEKPRVTRKKTGIVGSRTDGAPTGSSGRAFKPTTVF